MKSNPVYFLVPCRDRTPRSAAVNRLNTYCANRAVKFSKISLNYVRANFQNYDNIHHNIPPLLNNTLHHPSPSLLIQMSRIQYPHSSQVVSPTTLILGIQRTKSKRNKFLQRSMRAFLVQLYKCQGVIQVKLSYLNLFKFSFS